MLSVLPSTASMVPRMRTVGVGACCAKTDVAADAARMVAAAKVAASRRDTRGIEFNMALVPPRLLRRSNTATPEVQGYSFTDLSSRPSEARAGTHNHRKQRCEWSLPIRLTDGFRGMGPRVRGDDRESWVTSAASARPFRR